MDGRLSNFDAGPWRELSVAEGIRTIEIDDFKSYFEFVDRGFGDVDTRHLWRGQRDSSWEITSSLQRTGKRGGDILGNFRLAVARVSHVDYDISGRDDKAEEAKLRLWSLGQHHGLFTPLIDWTIYPYVALFFAFAEQDQTALKRAVFALDWGTIQLLNFDIMTGFENFRKNLKQPPYDESFKELLRKNYGGNFGEEDVHLIDESKIPIAAQERLCRWEKTRLEARQLHMVIPRTNENARIHSQGGRHLYTPEDVPLENWIWDHANAEHPSRSRLLTKILIPNSERTSILRSLNKMNINYLTLFPDVEGAAKHCNMALYEQHRTGLREY